MRDRNDRNNRYRMDYRSDEKEGNATMGIVIAGVGIG